ncbi:MAG: hypothetical protein ACM3KH_00750 [Thiobacillus sp.]
MSDQVYDEIAIERLVKDKFGVNADIRQMIIHNTPVGRMVNATLFLTSKKQLYLLIVGQSKLLLGDVQKIVTRMGLKTEQYMTPKGQPNYFNEAAKSKFYEVFPGRKNISEDDLRFYRTLTPYNPALIAISEIKDGHVYRFDEDATTCWRPAAKFTYRRIKTS